MRRYTSARLLKNSFGKFFAVIGFVILTGISSGVQAQAAATFTANNRSINIAQLDKQVESLIKAVGVPGLSLAVINDNRVVFFNTYGFKEIAKQEKVDKQTIFEACSLSKNYLAFVVYQLVDEGKLDLDKPLYLYLTNELLEHDPRYKRITARMVLSHCSGIENWKHENNPDTLEILDEPGKRFIYSGEGYQYLSKIVEKILNEPYSAYIKERVFDKLHLKRTFLQYSDGGAYPVDYATGYDNFGKPLKVWKNLEPVPASGVHTIAKDHATLIASFFDKQFLSPARKKDILMPMINLSEDPAPVYYSPGFEISYQQTDTIISHGGNNPGFKAHLFYSVRHKCGFVFLANGNLGKLLAKKLSELTVGLDVSPFFKHDFYEQYPCPALTLFRIYREKDAGELFAAIEAMKEKTGGKIGVNTLNQLGDILANGGDIATAKKLAEENTKLYPGSAQAFFLLGAIQMYQEEYKPAYTNLRKARELHFTEDPGIDYYIKLCAEKIGEK